MPGPSRPSSPHRSWRAGVRESSAGPKHVQRIALTLVGSALLGVLAWLLWWWIFLPSVYFVGLPIVDYDVLAVPPLRFAIEDVDAFSHLSRRGRGVLLRDLQISQGILTLANRLQGLAAGRRDTLILYLRAHGVSEDGKAWLLCSDYLPTAREGRCPLEELLRQIKSCPVAKKLLILDCDELAGDPRLGMIVNEFDELLEETVRRSGDSGLWVLASHRPFEASHVSQSAGRSAFGYFVVEGLKGAADQNGDGMIELAELADYVGSGVADWVSQDSGGAEVQSPRLLHGGEGAAGAPPGLSLLTVSDHDREANDGPAGEAPPDAAGKPDLAHQNASPRQKAAKQAEALLEQAWRLRDQIEQPVAAAPVTPIDYAPHLWRAYQELLLGYERRYRGDTQSDPAKLADDLRTNVLPVASLVPGQPSSPAVGKATIVSRLVDAQERFLAKFKEEWADQLAKDPRARHYLELVRARNGFVFRATDYVRWLAAAAPNSPRRNRLYQPIADFLAALGPFVNQLESLESTAASAAESNRVDDALASLSLQAETLQGLRRAIEEEGLQKDAADLIDAATKDPAKKGLTGPMESLLATPLLPATLRARLLHARGKLQQPLPIGEERAAAGVRQPASLARWTSQLHDQAAMEEQLVALADPAAKLPAIKTPAEWGNTASAGALSAGYRALGKAVGDFYRRLPEEINQAQPGEPAAAGQCERRLRAVDARDAAVVRDDVVTMVVHALRFPLSPEFHLAIREPRDTLALEPDGHPMPLEIGVEASGHPPGAAQWMVTYDARELALDFEGGKTPVAPGKWTDFSLAEDVTRLKYAVVARVPGGRETSLTVNVRCGEKSASRRIPIRLPSPDVIDMVVYQTGGRVERRIEASEPFHLRPFPNRINTYRFELLNRAGREKAVRVQFLAVPKLPRGRPPARELVLDAGGNPLSDLVAITPPLEMKLPAGEDAVPIRFPEPKPAAAEKGAAKGAAASETAPSPAPQSPPIGGLACVIRNAATGEAKWIKWIDFAPRTPRDYVVPRVSYNAAEGKIHVLVLPAAADELPPLSPETPINVVWNTEGELDPNVAVKSKAAIAAADQSAVLYADVSPNAERKVSVRLAVDDYPRAFVYEVKCDRDRPEIRPDRDRRQVRITSPVQDQAFRIPLTAPIPVEFQADAPEDAFREPGDRVKVRIIADDGNRELCPEEQPEFFSDRQTTIRLQQLTGQGEMKIDARVGDFKVLMNADGLKNMKVRIAVELRLANRELAENSRPVADLVRVVLDAAPPVFDIEVPGRPVPRGEPVWVSSTVRDELSGIEKMEFGFDLQHADEFDKKIEPKVVRHANGGTWNAALPSNDLEPGHYRVLVRATDRVGYASKQVKLVTIGPPPMPVPTAPAAPKMVTITGRILLQDGRPLSNIRVTLRGTPQTAVTDAEGRFVFRDLAPGKYVIEAKGTALGRDVSGSQAVTLSTATEPAAVELRLEW